MSKKRGNGEGSITRYTNGRWCARYTIQTAKGPKRKALYGTTRQEVAEKLAKALSDRAGGLIFEGGTITVGDYLDR
jgi:integrase